MRQSKSCDDWRPQTYKYLLNERMGDPKRKDQKNEQNVLMN